MFIVRANGEEYVATFMVAGNSRWYAGRFGVTPMADPTDGVLDLVLYTGLDRPGLAAFWLGVPTGLHLRGKKVLYLHAERAEVLPVSNDEPIWFQTDGELAGRLPAPWRSSRTLSRCWCRRGAACPGAAARALPQHPDHIHRVQVDVVVGGRRPLGAGPLDGHRVVARGQEAALPDCLLEEGAWRCRSPPAPAPGRRA